MPDPTNESLSGKQPPTWQPQLTQDGSFTFFSETFGEAFHSSQGAKTEAFQKFAAATQLAEQARKPSLRLLDVCYGLGYNTAAALETIWQINPHCQVEVYGLELDPTVPLGAIAPPLLETWSPPLQTILQSLATSQQAQTPSLNAQLLLGDARQTLQQVRAIAFQADAIFFDPFSPRRCPQLWTVEFFQGVADCLASTGRLATYSRAASVRSALQLAGLQIGSIPLKHSESSHEWSQGTVAGFEPQSDALSPMEQEHLQTRAAVPYRDPSLSDSMEEILERHRQEQGRSLLESTSSWRRRWGIH
ncbi:MAG: MnmC family methyltransferase [Oculatellaceae cyanobacterium Prado106]|jgi:tRNA U34 5-methylaminomethyl-2-thiouridine-forming methyltransferase MnmC|nr:MnmC family methyltransferase [Oculatellaceae cyanobacterium Prado106]